MTKVAIITRTKDRPTFLKRAINSVQHQSYEEYVHVIVNDGGDKSVLDEVIASFDEETTNKIKIFHRKVSSEAPDTIYSESADRVDSEYVVMHDDDDTWHPEFLVRAVAHLERSSSKGVVVRTDKVSEEIDLDGSIKHLKTEHWMPHVKIINLYRQCIENQLTPISFIYRRDAYNEIGGYDSSLPVAGDWDFGIRFLLKYDVDFLDPGFALACYHHREYKPSVEGNTSYTDSEKARYWTNYLMNKYLRQELAEGRIGVGYIMNKLRYNESAMATIVRRVLPKFITNRLEKRIKN